MEILLSLQRDWISLPRRLGWGYERSLGSFWWLCGLRLLTWLMQLLGAEQRCPRCGFWRVRDVCHDGEVCLLFGHRHLLSNEDGLVYDARKATEGL